MAEEFDWTGITGEAIARLRMPKLPPAPPAHIVALAQRTYDGYEHPETGETVHASSHDFEGNMKRRDQFVELIKAAGAHTSPPTTVRVAVDPYQNGNESEISWSAGERRGRKV